MPKIKPIDFNAETFNYIKEDLNKELNLLLKNMEDMGSDAGKLTMTITVTLEDKALDDGDEHTVPEFKHKIKSGFQVQHDCEGEMEGDYVLEKGKDGNYQLSLLTEQLDMLEEDEEEDAEEPEEID